MASIVLLLATLGSWLLFAGPIYQAALELHDHDMAAERIRRAADSALSLPPISWWWWLLPPVKIALSWRRARAQRDAQMKALSAEDFASLVGFIHKATGWTMVASGGLLTASAQTYAIAHSHHIGDAAFLAIVAAAAIACVVGCTARLRSGQRLVEEKKRTSDEAG